MRDAVKNGVRASVLLMPCLLAGCTLLGLDDFALPQCQRHADCEVLNEAQGIPADACQRFGCVVGSCELRDGDLDGDGVRAVRCGGDDCDDDAVETFPGANERCDQVDNDCDAIADEGVGVLAERALPIRSSDPVEHIAWAGTTVLWSTDRQTGFLAEVDSSARELSYAREAEEGNLMRPALGSEDVCPRRSAGTIVEDRCNFAGLAAAQASGSALFTAVVSQAGCRDGQLRIARLDTPADGRLVLRGPSVRSNVYLGVDVQAEGRCTGASREGGPLGVAFPFLASRVDGELSRALGIWLADSAERDVCSRALANVEVLEVLEESGFSGGETIHWLTGSRDGRPQVIGVGRGRPAALALESGAYLVAYGDGDGDVAIHRVDASTRPEAVAPDARPDDGRSTAALSLMSPARVLDADEPAFEVLLAEGEEAIGIVWTEGCQPGRVRFAELDKRTLAPRFVHTVGEGAQSAPSLRATTLGRWLVAWGSDEQVQLVQVRREGVESLSALSAAVAPGTRMRVDAGDETSVAFVARERREVRWADLSCPETAFDGGMK